MKSKDIVLLSIRPVFAMRIFGGKKGYEFRKRQFSVSVRKVVVYASMPIGKVIGEFKVAKVEKGSPIEIWNKCKNTAGISKKDFFDYYRNADSAVAIKIENPVLYHAPLNISRFCERPPQSYCYL